MLLYKLHLNFDKLIINSIYVLVKDYDVFLLSKNLIYIYYHLVNIFIKLKCLLN